jgi:hypothetical protein
MSNLPTWPGADTVYTRLQRINTTLCKRAYEAAFAERKTKKNASGTRKKFQWTVPEDVEQNIQAMNRGDEEACKAAVSRHLALALEA